jgi:hypothetical protein
MRLEGSAFAHFRSISRFSNWLNYLKLEKLLKGGLVAKANGKVALFHRAKTSTMGRYLP